MKIVTKKLFNLTLLAVGVTVATLSFVLVSCDDKVEITQKYNVIQPVYMTTDEIRSSLEIVEPITLQNPGKIYLYKDYVLINEPGKGIHVINNANPSVPDIINFINIPGNYEMSVRGDRLYADSYMDLVVLDISDVENITLVSRVEDIFLNLVANAGYYNPENGVIVDWEQVEVIEVKETDVSGTFPSYYYYNTGFFAVRNDVMYAMEASYYAPSTPNIQTGVGGSMARFTIVDDYLYSIDNSALQVFDISDLDNPVTGTKISVGWGLETIFPYNNNLFIGTQSGMHVYSNDDPSSPKHVSSFEHLRSCDPVVVENDIAYVTLRGGSSCNGFTNQLDVIDISNLENPKLIKSYDMTSPYGLGIDNGTLFICEGDNGLKIFDAKDVNKITDNLLVHYDELHAYDVIPYNKNLLMIGNDGLYQFDYSDPKDIKFLSMISIDNEQGVQ